MVTEIVSERSAQTFLCIDNQTPYALVLPESREQIR